MPTSASSAKDRNSELTVTLSKASDLQQDSAKKPVTRDPTAEIGKLNNVFLDKATTKLGRPSPIRSRITLAQGSCPSSRMDNQCQVVASSSNCVKAGDRDERPKQNPFSGTNPLSQLDSLNRTATPQEGKLEDKKSRTLHKTPGSTKATNAGAPLDPIAFKEENRSDSHTNGANSSHSPVTTGQSNQLSAAGSLARSSGEDAAQQNLEGTQRPTQPPGQQPRRRSTGKEGGRGGNKDAPPSADIPRSFSPTQAVDQEPRFAKPSGEAEHSNSGEARGFGSCPSVARAGHVLNPRVVTCDAIITDTHDNISRSRVSAQVLRGILGNGDKNRGSTVGRQTNSSGPPNNRVNVSEVNPLHCASHVSAASDSDGNVEMPYHSSFDYGDEASSTQSSATQIDVRADDLHPYGGGDYDGTGTFGDEQSFANRRGKLEWLRTPSLFYFFANVIKWNELQLQRKALLSSWQAHQQHGSQATVSLVSVWTQHRERELRTLEAHISFSAFELEGVYLNRLLIRWSKPKLRSLVANVVSTWKREGPNSARFDSVSSRLFEAISSEEACQLCCTWVFRVQQWLGRAQHRWMVSGMLLVYFVVAILCIVFLAVYGRTHTVVCIVLSAVLGVAVMFMYVLAMFILHHNTYASAAATYFREAAVRAAQQKMQEEELEEVDDFAGVNSYGENEEKYGGLRGRVMGGLANSNEMDTRSDYTAEQMSLAVRNLRALTEGNPHPANCGAPYYRVLEDFHGGRHESGTAAGGYYHDDMTLTDDNAPSLTSRPPQVGDAARQKQDPDRDDTLLLSPVTYEQHQQYLKQRQSLLIQETMGSSKVRSDGAGVAMEDHVEGDTNGKEHVSGGSGGMRGGVGRRDGGVDGSTDLQQLADLPDKVSITVLIYCNNTSVLSEVAPSLWERMFVLLRVTDLHVLDSAFKHGSERFKVILIHAPDAPEESEVLRTALRWLQVERRPVFFASRHTDAFARQVPHSARLKVPFTPAAIHAMFLAGIHVEAELGSVSFPALLQQEQSSSQPFRAPPYVLGRRLGGGAYGNVFEAEMEQSGAKCAVKRMYLKEEDSDHGDHEEHGGHSNTAANTSARGVASGERKPTDGEVCRKTSSGAGEATGEAAGNRDVDGGAVGVGSQLREIAQEVEIMSSLQHPNIVRYYFCERDDNCISIFMELCTGGSLSSLIHSCKLVDPPAIKLLLREVISAVAYLHSLRIVHRDLKPDNVLFRQGHAKITDFGTAVHKHGCHLRLIKGTFAYMAPETLVGEPYGSACDVWSIGCIAAEVLAVDLPQHALGLPAMCDYYRAMERDSTLPIACDVPGVRDFLLACLRRDPSERSTAAELFYHPILQARDAAIQSWMQKVVEQRRHKNILQHKMSHRIRPGGRGNGEPGSPHAGPNSLHGGNVGGRDGFDLSSGNGGINSLDSSQLAGHEGQADSLLTP